MNKLELKEFKNKYNLSIQDLATITKVSIGAVKSWESGQRNMSQSAIALLDLYVKNLPEETSVNYAQELTVEHNHIDPAGRRLAEYVNQKKLSIKDFGTKCGIGYNNTASILKGSLPIGMQVLQKIKKAFPSINTEWILFGNGSMELNSEPLIIDISKDIDRLEQTNNLLLDALKDKEKTISSLEDQVQMLKEWKDLKSLEENPIKSNMGK